MATHCNLEQGHSDRCPMRHPAACIPLGLSVPAQEVQRALLCARQVACELDLWQEAFRSVEDIQGLTAMGRKAPKPQLMATYYAKLTRIFTVSDAHLYNGCAPHLGRPRWQLSSAC